jgi:recombination DNA repair RAD52 pathway protein
MDTLNEDVLSEEQLEALAVSLTEDEIETKQGNLQYLKGQYAIAKANRIFGVGNWGYEQIGPLEMIETVTSGSNDKKVVLVTAMVKVTVKGCIAFVEQGDCEAQGAGYAALSMARKGAVTDGVKRCLKNFGPAFGLELYLGKQVPKSRSYQGSSNNSNQGQYRQQAPQPTRPPVLPANTQNAPQTATTAPQKSEQKPERITKIQLAAIVKMQETLRISDAAMESRVNQLYGSNLIDISKRDADHLIKVLTEVTTNPKKETQAQAQAQPVQPEAKPQAQPLFGPDAPNGQTDSWCGECAGPAIWKSGITDGEVWGGYVCQDKNCKKIQYVKVK